MKDLVERIKNSSEWNLKDLEELCKEAGLLEEWQAADGETFEAVAFKAAEILGVEIIAEEPRKWYAAMRDRDDSDWGTGSYNLEEAKAIAKGLGDEAYIAVIQQGNDPVCIDEIKQEDF